MLIFLMVCIFGSSLIANQESIKDSKNTKYPKNDLVLYNSSHKKNKNNSKKHSQKYQPKKESARLIGSIAQIVDDPRDSDNVLSAILNIISIFFKYIQHVESEHDFDHRSISSNAEMELIVTACYALLSKLNLPDHEKYHIINEVRLKIVELNDQSMKYYDEDQVEFVELC